MFIVYTSHIYLQQLLYCVSNFKSLMWIIIITEQLVMVSDLCLNVVDDFFFKCLTDIVSW